VYDKLANGSPRWETLATKNSVDNESNSPQYLGVASLDLQQVDNDFEYGPLSREICSRRKLMPAKKKAAKKKKH
jgi:hypothetical protein